MRKMAKTFVTDRSKMSVHRCQRPTVYITTFYAVFHFFSYAYTRVANAKIA